MLVDYRKMDTWAHRLNPKVSMLVVLFVIVASIVWTNVLFLGALTLALYLAGVSCRFPWKQIAWFLKFALFASVLILVIQAFTIDTSLIRSEWIQKTVLFYVLPNQKGAVMLGGLLYGLAACLKIYMVVFAIAILGFTVPPTEFIRGLSKLPFAAKQLTFIFSTAWRFIPIIRGQAINLMNAQKTRGMELEKGKLGVKLKKMMRIVTPLLSNSLEIGSDIALTMEARGFGATKKSKFVRPVKTSVGASAACIAVLVLIAALIYTSTLGIGVM
jgi:energy-coupling factor transport system permease protein